MVYGFVRTIQDDVNIFTHWIQGKELPDVEEEDQEQRIQAAALRMLVCIGIAFGALWTFSLLTFVITIPIKIFLNLATAVGIYTLGHDVFIMIRNARQEDVEEGFVSGFLGLFKGQEALEEEQAQLFTEDTFLQPMWMWAYANRSNILLKDE